MSEDTGEIAVVRERIARVEYEFHHPPDKELAWDRIKDEARFAPLVAVYYGRADALLDALGLRQVGWMVWEDPQDSDSWISVDLDFEDLIHYPHRPLFTASHSGSRECSRCGHDLANHYADADVSWCANCDAPCPAEAPLTARSGDV